MEVVAAILGSAVTETCRSLCGYYPSIKNFISFQSNLTTLEKEMKILVDLKNKVIHDVDYSSDAQMTLWLREVEQILLDVNSVQASMTASNQKLCGCFFNCSGRYRLGKEIARMLKEIERLLKVGDIAVKMVGRNYLAKEVEYIPGPSIVNQTTASQNLAKVMDLLNDDDVKKIGVWGMGGVGKTTLVKNLNNQLKGSSSTHQFGIVIWATLSQNLDLKKVQIRLAERLNLNASMEESVEGLASRLHQRLTEVKFLLILDDVWETINLDSLGVPQSEARIGSKIILTSRSLEVCREMKTDKEVKVEVLNDEESWQLFKQNSGYVSTLEHIEPLARDVAKECSNLPLAITIVGAAMRGKTMTELWKDALNELRRSVPFAKGIENNVYRPLKWSYDSLQGKNIKPCFLYCCLYPEDFSIDVSELVNCWMGEGLIDEQPNYEDSYNRGIALIENLKDSCLLEHGAREGTVKMHDIVRDVAVWISSTLEDGCKSLVRAGIGLSQISKTEMLRSLRVSFMHNRIKELPDYGMCCPETVSLLLQGNLPLIRIPDGFLQAFQSLKVLNLSGTHIQSLPESILKLGDLRTLLLKDCNFLEELPQLGGLSQLQVLDCSATSIRELPSGMKNLIYLRQLILSRTHKLKTIQSGIVSRLSSLEVLDMTHGAYVWGLKREANDGQATFEELQNLERLHSLSIRLEGIPSLQNENLTLIGRLRIFKLRIGPKAIYLQSKQDERQLILGGLQLSGEWIGWLLSNASSMQLHNCSGLNEMLETLVIRSIGSYTGLKSLTITKSSSIFRAGGGCAAHDDLLPNLEELRLQDLIKLGSISELVGFLGLRFSRLKSIDVFRCDGLEYLLTCGDFIISLPKLETIQVSSCKSLVELFNFPLQENFVPEPVVPNLQTLKLVNLPSLETLSRQDESGLHSKFISCVYHMKAIKQVEVISCNYLSKLPLTIQNANTVKEIRGEVQWWRRLELEEHNTKSSLERFFKEMSYEEVTDEYYRYC